VETLTLERERHFARTTVGRAAEHGEEKTVTIDATYPKAHRAATGMGREKGAWPPGSVETQGRA